MDKVRDVQRSSTRRDREDTERLSEGIKPAAAPLEQAPAPSGILSRIPGWLADTHTP